MNREALRGTVRQIRRTGDGLVGAIVLDSEPGKEYTFTERDLARNGTHARDIAQGSRVYCWKSGTEHLGVSLFMFNQQ